MNENPFKSKTSTNQLRGWPIGGRMLTVDFSAYSVCKHGSDAPIEIRVFDDGDLSAYLAISLDAIMVISAGDDSFARHYPNGSADRYTVTRDDTSITVAGGYGDGLVTFSHKEWQRVVSGAAVLMAWTPEEDD